MPHSSIRFAALLATAIAITAPAYAQSVGYISSSSGYMLHMSGSTAVTANWSGQAPISGFTGYGQIKMNGRCLTGKNGNQPLTWEGCNSSERAQKWSLQNRTLRNEGGWCADVEGGRVPVVRPGRRALDVQAGGQVRRRDDLDAPLERLGHSPSVSGSGLGQDEGVAVSQVVHVGDVDKSADHRVDERQSGEPERDEREVITVDNERWMGCAIIGVD